MSKGDLPDWTPGSHKASNRGNNDYAFDPGNIPEFDFINGQVQLCSSFMLNRDKNGGAKFNVPPKKGRILFVFFCKIGLWDHYVHHS